MSYSADLDFTKVTGGKIQGSETTNEVTVVPDNDERKKDSDTTYNEIQISSTGKSLKDEKTEGNKKTYTWTIDVNKEQVKNVGGDKIKDTNKSSDVMSYSGSGITVYKYDGNTLVGSEVVTWNSLTKDGNESWEYTIPSTDKAYHYVIEYTTEVDTSTLLSNHAISNGVEGPGGQSWAGTTVDVGGNKINIQKDFESYNPDTNAVKWKITVPIPESGLSNLIIHDTFPSSTWYGYETNGEAGESWESTTLYDEYVTGSL